MANFQYKVNLDIAPPSSSPGSSIKLTAHFSDVEGEIKSAYISVPSYGIWETLRKVDDSTFVLSYDIPYMAPSGEYTINVYATSSENERGPSQSVVYRIS